MMQSITAFSSVCILVHGTWAQEEVWYRPGGLFYDAVVRSPYNTFDDIISFSWSGVLSHDARMQAGYELALEILSYDQVTIIAHSHGGNVAMIASQYLSYWYEQGRISFPSYPIQALYLLGTPIQVASYAPAMHIIRYVYNLFSFEDMVQPILGIFGRVFPAHKRIANLSVYIHGQAPGHTQFQVPVVGYDVLGIHELLQQHSEPLGFEKFSFLESGALYFTQYNHVAYVYEFDRLKKLQQDEHLQRQLLQIMTRSNVVEIAGYEQFGLSSRYEGDIVKAAKMYIVERQRL